MSPSESLFGTDGIRGRFGTPPLVESSVTRLGAALGRLLQEHGIPQQVLVAGDTRASTPELSAWLRAGLAAAGCEALDGGTLPTPAVSHLTRSHHLGAGIAVSASHNPAPDNGIKLFTPEGFKWSRRRERQLEELLAPTPVPENAPLVPPAPLRQRALQDEYLNWLDSTLPPGCDLHGLSIVVDAANGAASALVEPLFASTGAAVTILNAAPDGTNINQECGSTYPEVVTAAVREIGADIGLSLDGDADRVLFSDAEGRLRDGDASLYLWARDSLRSGQLDPSRVVATVMSNLGLEQALRRQGIELLRADVGDREVVATMRREGVELGGEQSGHTVNLELSSTGDGMLTALHILGIVAQNGRSLADLLGDLENHPQVLLNVPVREKPPLEEIFGLTEACQQVEAELGERGRLLLRYSGTEPLARIMLEGTDQEELQQMAEHLAEVIRQGVGSE